MLRIRTYPDPILARRAKPVKTIDGALRKLISEMFETMYDARGVGLAAPQVGQGLRLCVVNCSGKKDGEAVLINPVVVESRGEATEEEGCLSLPGIRSKVTRSEWVRVRAYDQDGRELELEADGLQARCLQHELDHLNGRLLFQLLSDASQLTIRRRLRELEEAYREH